MVAIPWPKTSAPGKQPHLSGGRLVNCFHTPLVATTRKGEVWRRAPGLRSFGSTVRSGPRGNVIVGSTLYSAFLNNVTRFDAAGTATSVGTLSGSAGVFWARNNKAPTPDLVVVDPDNGAFIVTASSVTAYPDPDLPAVDSVCFLDGYFFFTTGAGLCYPSGLNATSIDPNSLQKCDGKPDTLLRAIAFTDLYLAGTDSIEVYHNTAETAPAFPFSRLKVIPCGIIGRYAISGFEDGLAKAIVFVGSDRCVYALNGYTPEIISTPDVEKAISDFIEAGGNPNSIQMFPYAVGGRQCIAMRSPVFTWVLDLGTLEWHERKSYDKDYWRACFALNAFGKWLASDTETGNIVEISPYARRELTTPLVVMLESGPVSGFPYRMAVPLASFDIAQGVGDAAGSDPDETNPTIRVSYSDDAGRSWTPPRIRTLGRQSATADPVKVARCGMTTTMGRRWRIEMSDAVDFELTGADQFAEPRMA